MLERLGPIIESRMRNKTNPSGDLYRFLSSSLVRPYIKKYLRLKLKRSVRYAAQFSPFYHQLFKENAIEAHQIKSPEDMKKIPLTTSGDIKNYERFLAVPNEQFIKVFSSSGTTGKPKRIFFTKHDLANQVSGVKTGLRLLYGLDASDSVRITYDHGYGIDDWGVRYCMSRAVEAIGAMSVLTGGRLQAEDEIELMRTYQISSIAGTPSYLHCLTHDMKQLADLTSFHIKNILLGTEPLTSSIRKNLENMWDTKVFQGYGMTEMGTSIAGECQMQDGLHITESDFFIEVIDPDTEELVADGDIGELVITTLSREGMPLLRYRTRDLGVIIPDRCSCGLPFRRILIKGRTDTMMTIGSGDNIYPAAFDEVLLKLPFICDYQVELTRPNDRDHLKIIIETRVKDPSIKQKVIDALYTLSEIKNGVMESKTIDPPEIVIVEPHTLERCMVKAKKVVDNRHLFD